MRTSGEQAEQEKGCRKAPCKAFARAGFLPLQRVRRGGGTNGAPGRGRRYRRRRNAVGDRLDLGLEVLQALRLKIVASGHRCWNVVRQELDPLDVDSAKPCANMGEGTSQVVWR